MESVYCFEEQNLAAVDPYPTSSTVVPITTTSPVSSTPTTPPTTQNTSAEIIINIKAGEPVTFSKPGLNFSCAIGFKLREIAATAPTTQQRQSTTSTTTTTIVSEVSLTNVIGMSIEEKRNRIELLIMFYN